MALVHDTLWVADIDVMRVRAVTGAPVGQCGSRSSLSQRCGRAPDGSLYITDTAVRFGAKRRHVGTDQIFRIAPDHKVSVALKSDLGRPNGIT
jgi:hypothetical protein